MNPQLRRRHTAPYYHRPTGITIAMAPRRSGKTHRLIEEAIHHVGIHRRDGDDPKAFIIAPNQRSVEHIREYLYDEIKNFGLDRRDFHCLSIDRMRDYSRFHTYLHNTGSHVECFFDDFEEMEHVPVIRDSYYTSTPNRAFGDSNARRIIGTIHTDHDIESDRQIERLLQAYGEAMPMEERFRYEREQAIADAMTYHSWLHAEDLTVDPPIPVRLNLDANGGLPAVDIEEEEERDMSESDSYWDRLGL